MEKSVTGKYAIVTGSTNGIGKQIASDLLRAGHFVILNYAHSETNAEKIKNELSVISNNFSIIKADLSTNEGLDLLVSSIKKITIRLDCIILNAGATTREAFMDISSKSWNEVFYTNLMIPFFLVQRLFDLIQNDGRIIFIGSVLGRVPHAVSIPYGVSKGALEVLVKYLVPFGKDKNITFNVVAPGFTETEWHKGKDSEQRKRIEGKIACGRFARTKEISSTCMLLINNGYINGQIIYVDGGYALI